MTTSLRSICGWLVVLLACNISCNTDDCDESCYYDHKHCTEKAQDDAQRSRCDAELDQCRGICAAQPMDTGQRH
jgi:hypothetical protein